MYFGKYTVTETKCKLKYENHLTRKVFTFNGNNSKFKIEINCFILS